MGGSVLADDARRQRGAKLGGPIDWPFYRRRFQARQLADEYSPRPRLLPALDTFVAARSPDKLDIKFRSQLGACIELGNCSPVSAGERVARWLASLLNAGARSCLLVNGDDAVGAGSSMACETLVEPKPSALRDRGCHRRERWLVRVRNGRRSLFATAFKSETNRAADRPACAERRAALRRRSRLSAVPFLCPVALDLRQPTRRCAHDRPVFARSGRSRTRTRGNSALAPVTATADSALHRLSKSHGDSGQDRGPIVFDIRANWDSLAG